MSVERDFFKLIQELGCTDEYNDAEYSIHFNDCMDDEQEMSYRIYHSKGYCWNIRREQVCDPREYPEYEYHQDLEEDGAIYFFSEPYDGFRNEGIDKAIEIMKGYVS